MVRTGFVFEEKYMWHNPGNLSENDWIEPCEHWENADTKRRFYHLLSISNLLEQLHPIKARTALRSEITLFHTSCYHDNVEQLSAKNGGNAGELAFFAKGGYDIASLSVGGVLAAVEAVLNGQIDNAYCLVRPPGHHAEKDKGMGFCIFNNIAIAALYAKSFKSLNINKIAIIDYDVHHGNGTQQAFWNDPDVLFVSLHQDNNYPVGEGSIEQIGGENAVGTNINIPLPPGSGTGAYEYAFSKVVIPAIDRFKPDFIFVSSGFDAAFCDPLASMILTSEAFGNMAKRLIEAANAHCQGRIIFAHEGGYSKDYVPFCGVAVVEALSGIKTNVEDPYLDEVKQWGYQSCQVHQKEVIDKVVNLHHFHLNDDSKSASLLNRNNVLVVKNIENNNVNSGNEGENNKDRMTREIDDVLKKYNVDVEKKNFILKFIGSS
jgi:acetoin utilization deacetylase AcuC-like enzyme